jgi:FkbM family methyltransferase
LADQLDRMLAPQVSVVRNQKFHLFERIIKPNAGSIVLYGAGFMGREALAALRSVGITPLAFADDDERTIEGIAVIKPALISRLFPRATVFITIPLPYAQFAAKADQLRRRGCKNVFFGSELFNALERPYFYIDLPHKTLLAKAEIKRAFHLFSDNWSRREFITQISMRLSVASEAARTLPLDQEYCPAGIFTRRDDEFFVDCGAYNGDTLSAFLRWQEGRFGRVLALEPDWRSFASLQKSIAKMPVRLQKKISALPTAAGAIDGTLRFSAIGTAESQISASAEGRNVPVAKLDSLLADSAPTCIKMDIEGAELDALKGAAETIKRVRPVLAICVYHQQDHLWKIPLFIRSLCDDYRFILRAYMPGRLETVCYAVPKERAIA